MADGPLPEGTLEQLKERMDDLKVADQEIERAVRAGFDVTEQRKRVTELRERLIKIRNAYYPGQ